MNLSKLQSKAVDKIIVTYAYFIKKYIKDKDRLPEYYVKPYKPNLSIQSKGKMK
jgi:hypothetical protein